MRKVGAFATLRRKRGPTRAGARASGLFDLLAAGATAGLLRPADEHLPVARLGDPALIEVAVSPPRSSPQVGARSVPCDGTAAVPYASCVTPSPAQLRDSTLIGPGTPV